MLWVKGRRLTTTLSRRSKALAQIAATAPVAILITSPEGKEIADGGGEARLGSGYRR